MYFVVEYQFFQFQFFHIKLTPLRGIVINLHEYKSPIIINNNENTSTHEHQIAE